LLAARLWFIFAGHLPFSRLFYRTIHSASFHVTFRTGGFRAAFVSYAMPVPPPRFDTMPAEPPLRFAQFARLHSLNAAHAFLYATPRVTALPLHYTNTSYARACRYRVSGYLLPLHTRMPVHRNFPHAWIRFDSRFGFCVYYWTRNACARTFAWPGRALPFCTVSWIINITHFALPHCLYCIAHTVEHHLFTALAGMLRGHRLLRTTGSHFASCATLAHTFHRSTAFACRAARFGSFAFHAHRLVGSGSQDISSCLNDLRTGTRARTIGSGHLACWFSAFFTFLSFTMPSAAYAHRFCLHHCSHATPFTAHAVRARTAGFRSFHYYATRCARAPAVARCAPFRFPRRTSFLFA